MKVVAFNTSPRRRGNTALLLQTTLDVIAQHGIETQIVHLGGRNIHPCQACYKCAQNMDRRCIFGDDPINDCIEKLVEADGILLGTPTYFADVSAQAKAFIDRTGLVCRVNGNLLRRKVGAGLVAVRRAGALHAFNTLNHYFLIAEMVVPGSIYWNLGIGKAEGEVSEDEEGMRTARTLGENMAWLLSRIHQREPDAAPGDNADSA